MEVSHLPFLMVVTWRKTIDTFKKVGINLSNSNSQQRKERVEKTNVAIAGRSPTKVIADRFHS